MATHTKRDRIWSTALLLACRTERFALSDVYAECDAGEPAERTVRDVLTTMADEDWLEKHTAPDDGQRLYSAGPGLDEAADRLVDATR